MAGENNVAANFLTVNPSGTGLIRFPLFYGTGEVGVGITNVDPKTNRITFDRRIHTVRMIDAGGIEIVRRRCPILGKPIEIGVPPPTPAPKKGIRICFNGLGRQQVFIQGLESV